MERRLGTSVAVVSCVALATALAVVCGGCGTGANKPVDLTEASPAVAQSVQGAKPGDTFTVATFEKGVPGCAISGTRVVWLQQTADGRNELRFKDLATGEEQVVAPHVLGSPAIDGDLVAWVGISPKVKPDTEVYGSAAFADIAGRDLASGRDLTICAATGDQFRPRVSDGTVVWEDWREGHKVGSDIYGWRLSDGAEFAVCTDAGDQWEPAIDGDLVVWASYDPASPTGVAPGSTQPPGLYGRRLASDEAVSVVTGSGAVEYPGVDGEVVLWKDMSDAPSLLGRDMAAGKDVIVQQPWLAGLDAGGGMPPFVVADGLVAYTTSDLQGGKPLGPLQIKDLASGKTWTAGSSCVSPAVSGDLVVWCEADPDAMGNAVAVKGLWVDR